MKSFGDFRFICEKLNKTFDEDAHAKVWNYFISNPEYTEVRDALKNKDKNKALELMRAELEKARGDSDHPLNFAKADDSEFAMTGKGKNKRANREDSDREQFDSEIEKAIGGVTSLATQKKFKDAVEKGFPARKTGASKAELSRTWSSAGGTNTTPKADLEVYDPDNERNRRGISLKKEGGSQIASAEGGELKGTYKAAAKALVKRMTDFKSKEERKRIENEIMNAATRVADINDRARTADNDEKEELKTTGQDILDKLHDKYPNLTRHVTQVSTTGDEKFRGKNAPGSAGTIVTGDKAKPAQEQPSARPRNAKPKGKGRPGNVKVDNKEGSTKSNQAQPQQGPMTLDTFNRQARTAELRSKGVGRERDERLAAEREAVKQERIERQAAARRARYAERKAQQTQQALFDTERDLEVASANAQNASIPINPETGEPILRQHRKNVEVHIATDPTSPIAQANNQIRQQAQNTLATAQSNYDTVSSKHQRSLQRLQQIKKSTRTQQPQQAQQPQEVQPQQPQEVQPQQPQEVQPQQPQEVQPQQPQEVQIKPKKRKRERTEAERADTRQRMDAAGEQQGYPN